MNMKKMKKFFTLSRRAEGFTLVELIVVIAILAILGGVAVPAYSGYVKKANMQADISLAAEVADALTLYYYSHPGEVTNGYVVLTPEGVDCSWDENDVGDAAMLSVFGEDWEKSLSLKYDGWMESAQGADGSVATTMDADTLAGSVDMLADLADAAIKINNPEKVGTVLGLFCDLSDDQLAELDAYKTDEDYGTIATNLMGKYIADELSNMQIVEEDGAVGYSELSFGSELALTYAMIYSMSNSDDAYSTQAGEILAKFDGDIADLVKREEDNAGETHVRDELEIILGDLLTSTVEDSEGNEIRFGDVYDSYLATNGMKELTGIKSAMSTLGDIANGYSDSESLSDDNFFVSDRVINAVKAFQIAATKNGVVVQMINGECQIVPNVSG